MGVARPAGHQYVLAKPSSIQAGILHTEQVEVEHRLGHTS
jgi:hypothetical protein